MTLAKIEFGLPVANASPDIAYDKAAEYVASIQKNGHIENDYQVSKNGSFFAIVTLFRPNALAKNLSPWSKSLQKEIAKLFGSKPNVSLLEPPPAIRYPNWRKAERLYLYTDLFDVSTPVRAHRQHFRVPIYEIPMDHREREYLDSWATTWRCCNTLWISSGALEMESYKQTADPNSKLSQTGRDHAAVIEEATSIPTYYYLYRYFGRRENEKDRLCPSCGGNWFDENSESEVKYTYPPFDFRCDKCRLISNLAYSDEDERRARIGEFRK